MADSLSTSVGVASTASNSMDHPTPGLYTNWWNSWILDGLHASIQHDDLETLQKVGALHLTMAKQFGIFPTMVVRMMRGMAWAANAFGGRDEDGIGNAQLGTKYQDVLELPGKPLALEVLLCQRISLGTADRASLPLTTANVRQAIRMLQEVISTGDGDSLVAAPARVLQCWAWAFEGEQLTMRRKLSSRRLVEGELRGLMVSAQVLGSRCLRGDFGSRMTPEEEALVLKLGEIVRRVHQLGENETSTPCSRWIEQLSHISAEVSSAPASDGNDEPFATRRHLRELPALVSTLDVDVKGCRALLDVYAMPMTQEEIRASLDSNNDGVVDEAELEAATIDLAPIYALEMAIKATAALSSTQLPCLFVAESETLLERRRIERALIEGVKESNAPDLISALSELDAKPELDVATALVLPARATVLKLSIEEALEAGIAERSVVKCKDALDLVDADGAPANLSIKLVKGARAMIDKLACFNTCQQAVDDSDANALKLAMDKAQHGWWNPHTERRSAVGSPGGSPNGSPAGKQRASVADADPINVHWYEADKEQLHMYLLEYKKLTVLTTIRENMEPLNAARLQAGVDTAHEVALSHALVDQAIEILKNRMDSPVHYA